MKIAAVALVVSGALFCSIELKAQNLKEAEALPIEIRLELLEDVFKSDPNIEGVTESLIWTTSIYKDASESLKKRLKKIWLTAAIYDFPLRPEFVNALKDVPHLDADFYESFIGKNLRQNFILANDSYDAALLLEMNQHLLRRGINTGINIPDEIENLILRVERMRSGGFAYRTLEKAQSQTSSQRVTSGLEAMKNYLHEKGISQQPYQTSLFYLEDFLANQVSNKEPWALQFAKQLLEAKDHVRLSLAAAAYGSMGPDGREGLLRLFYNTDERIALAAWGHLAVILNPQERLQIFKKENRESLKFHTFISFSWKLENEREFFWNAVDTMMSSNNEYDRKVALLRVPYEALRNGEKQAHSIVERGLSDSNSLNRQYARLILWLYPEPEKVRDVPGFGMPDLAFQRRAHLVDLINLEQTFVACDFGDIWNYFSQNRSKK